MMLNLLMHHVLKTKNFFHPALIVLTLESGLKALVETSFLMLQHVLIVHQGQLIRWVLLVLLASVGR
jgi:hypothetical protein